MAIIKQIIVKKKIKIVSNIQLSTFIYNLQNWGATYPYEWGQAILVQADLVICSLFICKFAFMWLRTILIYRTHPLIYTYPWSFHMRMRYMRVIFYCPYLSHIPRSACIYFVKNLFFIRICVKTSINLSLKFWNIKRKIDLTCSVSPSFLVSTSVKNFYIKKLWLGKIKVNRTRAILLSCKKIEEKLNI